MAILLGHRLGLDVYDLDRMIAKSQRCSIAEIFAAGGEELFREIEGQILLTAIDRDRSIISLGGGTIVRSANRQRIRGGGRCVWLTASPETIAARIAGDSASVANRPALTNRAEIDEIRTLLQRRDPWYREVADLTIDTDSQSTQTIADQIVDWFASDSLGRVRGR